MNSIEQDNQRERVRTRYGAIAEQAETNSSAECGCRAGGCCGGGSDENYTEALGYSADQRAAAPAGANLNLGCGNPLAQRTRRHGWSLTSI